MVNFSTRFSLLAAWCALAFVYAPTLAVPILDVATTSPFHAEAPLLALPLRAGSGEHTPGSVNHGTKGSSRKSMHSRSQVWGKTGGKTAKHRGRRGPLQPGLRQRGSKFFNVGLSADGLGASVTLDERNRPRHRRHIPRDDWHEHEHEHEHEHVHVHVDKHEHKRSALYIPHGPNTKYVISSSKLRRDGGDHDYDHDHDHDHDRDHDHDHDRDHDHRRKRNKRHDRDRGRHLKHKRTSVVLPPAYSAGYASPQQQWKRDQAGVPGTISVMGSGFNSTIADRIAYLFLDTTNSTSNSTGASNPTSAFVLNASDTNSTQIYLVAAPNNSTTGNSTMKPVSLEMAFFDPMRASLVSYCATFDPDPSSAEALAVEPCFNSSGSTTAPHKSQTFWYDSESGVLQPMWSGDGSDDDAGEDYYDDGASDDGTSDSSYSDSSDDESDDDTLDTQGVQNSTSTVSDAVNLTTWRRDSSMEAQPVSLVFVPSGPEAPLPQEPQEDNSGSADDIDPSQAIASSTTESSTVAPSSSFETFPSTTGSALTETTTTTSTMTATVTSNPSAGVEAIESTLTSTGAPTATASGPNSVANTPAASPASTSAVPLDVEIIGPGSFGTPNAEDIASSVAASSTLATISSTTSTSSSFTSPSSEIDFAW